MKKNLLLLLTLSFALAGFAQDWKERKEMKTANMERAMEAFYKNNDPSEAMKYFNAEIAANPKNGYAYSWMALIYQRYSEYGKAIEAASKAIQHLPRKDKEYAAFAYSTRADAYVELKEFDKALADYNAAIKAEPSAPSRYQSRADYYFIREEYGLAEKDYQKYISLDPTSPLGYLGIGRNHKQQGKCEEALQWFDKAIQLSSDYSRSYSFRAECYIKLGRFDEAASDIVTALDIDHDNKAFILMQELADSTYRTIVSRLKVQAEKEPNNSEWYYYLGIASERTKKYDKAIEYYTKGSTIDGGAYFYGSIADCHYKRGAFEAALHNINIAIEKDSTELDYRSTRIGVNYELGNMPAVFNDLDFCIAQNPSSLYWYYSRRGWFKKLNGDTEGAIEDYTASITLYQEYPRTYMSRGQLLMKEGDAAAARKDLLKCIALDTADMKSLSCAPYAYQALGDSRNALRLLDTMLAHDREGNLYDAACLHSLMGNHTKAIDYLRQALDDGYRHFTHIERDSDLDNIRNDEEFKQLVAHYKELWRKEVASDEAAIGSLVEKTSEIPFIRRNGITEVKCSINGLPLTFVFDTGAGDVTISSVEAAFMFKNGYLSDKDVVGRSAYRTASGDIHEGTVINLEKIEFGGMTLSNVRASVVHGQSAPLLLGQSVLSRLGKIEIENARQVIKITYHE